MSALARVLGAARGPVLVVGESLPELGVATLPPGGEVAAGLRYVTVVLVADDVAALRRLATLSRGLGRARTVVAVVGDAVGVVPIAAHPAWPAVTTLDARLDGGTAVTSVTFASRVRVDVVAAALGRAAAPGVRTGPAGLRVALLPDALALAPPVDLTLVTSLDPEAKRPPDVVVGSGDPAVSEPAVSEVTGVAPVVVPVPEAGVPVDEAVFDLDGFRRDWDRGVVDLPPDARLTVGLVRSLRDAQGVRLPDRADPALAAGLAMSGVPIETDGVDLDDPDAREAYAVQQSRAATAEHGTAAWRARLARRAGVRMTP